jgi:hypothetical protein
VKRRKDDQLRQSPEATAERAAASGARSLLVGLVLGLVACGSETDLGRPLPSPTTSPRKPVGVEGGRVRIWPNSVPVDSGVPYRFTLMTHCGLRVSYPDFDGSFWRYVGPGSSGGISAPAGFEDPSDAGTMILLDQRTAEFRSASGKSARFRRIRGPIEVLGCA